MLVPTRLQLLIVVFAALAVLVVSKGTSVIVHLGVTQSALQASQGQLRERFSGLSHSLLATNLTLVLFWSVVGLIAYLLCWSAYNLMVEARNELTVETQYQNLGGRRLPWAAVLTKAVCGLGLIAVLVALKFGLALSLALIAPLVSSITLSSALLGLAAVAVLALNLYLVIVFVELVFSAWYRPEAFTDGQ